MSAPKSDTEKMYSSRHEDNAQNAIEVVSQATVLLLPDSPVTAKGRTGLPGQSLKMTAEI